MHIIYGNMFDWYTYESDVYQRSSIRPDALVITTNGFVKSNGEAVMGRGCAKEAAKRFPELPRHLGKCIRKCGNHVKILSMYIPSIDFFSRALHIVSFPVKAIEEKCLSDKSNVVVHMRSKFQSDDNVPGWACKASLKLIEQSTLELKKLADEKHWSTVVLPRPGCGAGELAWRDVKPILEEHLDNRFYIISLRKDK